MIGSGFDRKVVSPVGPILVIVVGRFVFGLEADQVMQ